MTSYRYKLFVVLFIFTVSFLYQAKTGYTQNKPIVYLEWVENPLESIVINWINDSGANRTVEYRRQGTSSWSNATAAVNSIPATTKRRYSARITNLSPGTSYEFRISGISGTRKFRTAPASIEEPIRFLVGGDITETRGTSQQVQSLKDVFEAVTDLAASYNPLFLVVGGDFVHNEGPYPDVADWFYLLEKWSEKLVTEEGGYSIPLISTAGNHEVPDYGSTPEDAIFYHAFLSYPQAQWGQKRGYGVIDFANYLSIITLDTGLMHSVASQNSWLQNTLRNRRKFSHIYPVYHVPGWPTFRTMRDGTGLIDDIRNEWHPFFRDNNVRFVFEHHDHSYKRTNPFRCNPPVNNEKDCTVAERNGVIYAGGGTWGSIVRDIHPNYTSGVDRWVHAVNEFENNFVVMDVSETKRTLQAVSITQGILDTFEEVFFLPPPVAEEAIDILPNSFIANWDPVKDAQHYRLDVSTTNNFSTFLPGYEDLRVEGTTSFEVTDLIPGEIYYYRVRARTPPVVSNNSNIVEVETIGVDPDLSSLVAEGDFVQANNNDTSTIIVTARDEDGNELRNVPVSLFAESGNLIVNRTSRNTNSDGIAEFLVRNNRPQIVVYGAVAGGEELTDKVTVNFIPRAPVSLAASNVETREFTANWELVDHIDTYSLDISTDSTFSSYISGYQDRDVGNVTSHVVENILPGTNYVYRVRAIGAGLTGANSESIGVTTYPDVPEASEPSSISAVHFTANWDQAEGARNYLLDVAKDSHFENFVEGYENLDVGNNTSYKVSGLTHSTDYFYRVKSEAFPRISESSAVIPATTLTISEDQSDISSSQLRVLANGDQTNEIIVIVRSEEGVILDDLKVNLIPKNGSSQIEEIQSETSEEGMAQFGVTNMVAEKVTYSVFAESIPLGEITVEFLQDDGILKLGDNYPNPFNNQTVIPLTLPGSMEVNITIYNALGVRVRTLVNREIETGYHEIRLNSADLAAGVYFYRLTVADEVITKKMVLIK
jgi:acid phosphatase type 7